MQKNYVYNYQESLKKEDEICNFIDTIRNMTSEIIESRYIDKEYLNPQDIQRCIDDVWYYVLETIKKPTWVVCNNILKEGVSSFVHNFIKHEHDNLVSMGSASSIHWNNMLDSRSNLYEILRNQ
jgi:hypothetical protein